MKEICTERTLAIDSEKKELTQDLWRNAVCLAAIYGKTSKIEDIKLSEFDQTIIKNIESQDLPVFGRKKITKVTSVSQEIQDEKGKSAKITVASYAIGSSEINETRGISITVDNDFATFLIMRGKKINVETWERYGEVCWKVNMIDVNSGIKFASRNANLLQKSLSQKK